MISLPGYVSFLNSLVPAEPRSAGIRFRRITGGVVDFSQPVKFEMALLPRCPGLYAILVGTNGFLKPRRFRPLYFGEAGNLFNRVNSWHEKYNSWCRAASGD